MKQNIVLIKQCCSERKQDTIIFRNIGFSFLNIWDYFSIQVFLFILGLTMP